MKRTIPDLDWGGTNTPEPPPQPSDQTPAWDLVMVDIK